jgi:hypothetical protein
MIAGHDGARWDMTREERARWDMTRKERARWDMTREERAGLVRIGCAGQDRIRQERAGQGRSERLRRLRLITHSKHIRAFL